MKLSEVTKIKASVDAVADLRDMRRDIARCLKNFAQSGVALAGDGNAVITIVGDGVQHMQRALEQKLLDVDQELIGLDVEIDEAADADEYDDEAIGDLEEAA